MLGAYSAQPFRPMVVSGESMEPTYSNWQLFVADRRLPTLKRNDVVVVKTDEGTLLKRIAYVAGDSYLRWKDRDGSWDMVQMQPGKAIDDSRYRIMTVPADHVYVVGDNLIESRDSRQFGPVPISDVIAWLPGASEPKGGAITAEPLSKRMRSSFGQKAGRPGAQSSGPVEDTKISSWVPRRPLVE